MRILEESRFLFCGICCDWYYIDASRMAEGYLIIFQMLHFGAKQKISYRGKSELSGKTHITVFYSTVCLDMISISKFIFKIFPVVASSVML